MRANNLNLQPFSSIHRPMRVCLARSLFILVALALPAAAAGPVLVLIGPPSSGKTTQAEILHRDLGMAVISADDLIARNQERFQRFKNPALTGVEPRLDPALNALVEQALQNTDLTRGVVLDGYPAAVSQGEYLAGLREKLMLPKALVIHLQIPDAEVLRRLKQQKAADIDQQLKDYHREFDFAKTYFPEADLQTVDGTKAPDVVALEIRKLLQARGFGK